MRTKKAKHNGTAKRNGTPKAVASSDILTLEEAAAFLRVQAFELQGDAFAGLVPAKLVGGHWRFSKTAFLTWLQTPSEGMKMSGKEKLLAIAGLWKDDPTVDAMMADIDRQRGERVAAED